MLIQLITLLTDIKETQKDIFVVLQVLKEMRNLKVEKNPTFRYVLIYLRQRVMNNEINAYIINIRSWVVIIVLE